LGEEAERHVEAEPAAVDGGREGVVRAGRPGGNEPRRAKVAGPGEDELELANLVAAVRQPGLVIPLDPEAGAVAARIVERERLDRRRERGQGEPGQPARGLGVAAEEGAGLFVAETGGFHHRRTSSAPTARLVRIIGAPPPPPARRRPWRGP